MPDIEGRDAAFAKDVGNYGGIVAGYFGGPNAYHVWTPTDWAMFPTNLKIPIWVCGYNGEEEGQAAIGRLKAMGLSKIPIVADMEARVDKSYLVAFGGVLQAAGYQVFVYGSRATVFQNPKLQGYWVADWTGQAHMATNPNTGDSIGVRGTQYIPDVSPGYDVSVWKEWITPNLWR